MLPLATLIVFFCTAAVMTYRGVERRARRRWRQARLVERTGSGGDPFRAPMMLELVEPVHDTTRAPVEVRRAAFGSLVLGQAFVPLAVMAVASGSWLAGLLLGLPLFLTARLWINAIKMLRRDPSAAREAQALSSWLHVPSLAVLFVQPACTLLVFHDVLAPLAWAVAALTVVSYLQARALGRAAKALGSQSDAPLQALEA